VRVVGACIAIFTLTLLFFFENLTAVASANILQALQGLKSRPTCAIQPNDEKNVCLFTEIKPKRPWRDMQLKPRCAMDLFDKTNASRLAGSCAPVSLYITALPAIHVNTGGAHSLRTCQAVQAPALVYVCCVKSYSVPCCLDLAEHLFLQLVTSKTLG
jgi:hypothetical protein